MLCGNGNRHSYKHKFKLTNRKGKRQFSESNKSKHKPQYRWNSKSLHSKMTRKLWLKRSENRPSTLALKKLSAKLNLMLRNVNLKKKTADFRPMPRRLKPKKMLF